MQLDCRDFLRLGLVLPPALLIACGGDDDSASQAAAPTTKPSDAATNRGGGSQSSASPALTPTPACGDDPTPPQTEGPFFTPETPQRTSLLEPGLSGTTLIVEGYVLTRSCRPVAGALLDFWQADTNGEYDNVGFRLRGHQFSDADGRYRLETITPAQYQTRTPHIHVKVQAPNRPVLTTQLYFPDHPRNAEDFIFQPELVMALSGGATGETGRFDFVLDLA